MNKIGWSALAFITAIEVDADFIAGTNAIPNTKFREPSGRAFRRRGPADAAVLEFLRRRFALVGLEFAVLIEAKFSGRIPRDRDVSPRIGDGLFVGDDRVVNATTDPDTQFRIVEIDVEDTGRTEDTVAIANAGIEFDPRFDRERAI